ncbi:MAG: hypothetical protein ACRD2E_08480 [Terriglobales bacterium]
MSATCSATTPWIRLQWRRSFWHGSRAEVVLDPQVGNDMSNLKRMRALQTFRAKLLQLAALGCFGSVHTGQLLSEVASLAPVNPRTAFYLRYGPSPATGSVNLAPGFRLYSVTLVRSPAGPVVGQQTRWFAVRARRRRGVWVEPLGPSSAYWYLPGIRARRPPPLRLRFPPSAAYWRLVWWLGASHTNHTNMVVAAASRAALVRTTAAVQRRPAACAALAPNLHRTPGHAWCLPIPHRTVLTAELPITVQGKRRYVPFDLTLGQALPDLGVANPRSLLLTLRVWRRFRGRLAPLRFDRRSTAILQIPVMAGDQFRWQPASPRPHSPPRKP